MERLSSSELWEVKHKHIWPLCYTRCLKRFAHILFRDGICWHESAEESTDFVSLGYLGSASCLSITRSILTYFRPNMNLSSCKSHSTTNIRSMINKQSLWNMLYKVDGCMLNMNTCKELDVWLFQKCKKRRHQDLVKVSLYFKISACCQSSESSLHPHIFKVEVGDRQYLWFFTEQRAEG